MKNRFVDCPTCGNANAIGKYVGHVKCKWCRRPFVVKVIDKKGKQILEVQCADDNQQNPQ